MKLALPRNKIKLLKFFFFFFFPNQITAFDLLMDELLLHQI